jgi:hypothetical protein
MVAMAAAIGVRIGWHRGDPAEHVVTIKKL